MNNKPTQIDMNESQGLEQDLARLEMRFLHHAEDKLMQELKALIRRYLERKHEKRV